MNENRGRRGGTGGGREENGGEERERTVKGVKRKGQGLNLAPKVISKSRLLWMERRPL